MKQITEEQLLERKNPAVIDWAKEHNAITIQEFGNTDFFKETQKNTLDILQAQDKIPFVRFRGNYVYNFWQDANHNRGLIRRTTLEEYVKHEPTWEDVLDIDALAKDENKPWVYKGMTWLCPTYDRALVHLSDGGGDTVEIREFDIIKKSFINNGIYLPPAKSEVVWIHQDLLLIGTDVGEDALTNAGYPRTVRLMRRGQALAEAPIIFEGNKTDVAVDILSAVRPEGTIFCIQRAIDFFNCQYFIWNPEDPFCVTQVMVPTYVALEDIFQGELILRPREDWFINNQVYKAGSILSMHPFDPATIEIIYTAKDRTKVDSVSALKSKLVMKITDKNLNSKIYEAIKGTDGWLMGAVNFPVVGTMDLVTAEDSRDDYMVSHEGPLNPVKLYYVSPEVALPKIIKETPARFNAESMKVEQFQTISVDGTKIPYTVLSPKDMPLNGTTPTILYGYGGFEISLEPVYSASTGKNWVEQGGCYVVANIRGGGEFGPAWHQAALKEKRQVAYNDFIAVAEDLIARGITSPQYLGIKGASNGGLLVGAVFVQRPDLFQAVDCGVPLLRMLDYHKLSEGAGSSWIGEYGDPDDESNPAERLALANYSPYDNVRSDGIYPKVFFNTSMHDDRVHPGHARTMVHKMQGQGHPIFYFETLEEGGHGYANLQQTATQVALSYSYFSKLLGLTLKPKEVNQMEKKGRGMPMTSYQTSKTIEEKRVDLHHLVESSEAQQVSDNKTQPSF